LQLHLIVFQLCAAGVYNVQYFLYIYTALLTVLFSLPDGNGRPSGLPLDIAKLLSHVMLIRM